MRFSQFKHLWITQIENSEQNMENYFLEIETRMDSAGRGSRRLRDFQPIAGTWELLSHITSAIIFSALLD